MIKNIVFDYGKVLLDWNPHFLFDPYFDTKEKSDYFIDIILSDEWYNDGDIGTPMDEVVAKWSARYPEYADAFRYYIDSFDSSIREQVPGMYELVKDLKDRGYGVWGLSNWSWELFQRIMGGFPVFGLLDGMIISGKVHMLKPHPEIYRCLLDTYSLKAEECVFVDDREPNIAGAEAVGMRGILFRDPQQLRAELEPLLADSSLRSE